MAAGDERLRQALDVDGEAADMGAVVGEGDEYLQVIAPGTGTDCRGPSRQGAGHALFDADRRPPAEVALGPRGVAEEDFLIAGTPVSEGGHGHSFAQDLGQDGLELAPDGDRVLRPAAHVVDVAGGLIDVLGRQLVAANEVVDVEKVAHLLAVAVDAQLLAEHGGDHEPGDPALVFDAHLAGAVDAALPEDHGAQAVDAVVVAHVLVGGAFGATIGGMEVERLAFGCPLREVAVGVTAVLFDYLDVIHATVDLVGGGIQEDRVIARGARSLEGVEGARGVDLEIAARVGDRRGDGGLGGEVVNHLHAGHRLLQCGRVADVALCEAEILRVLVFEPGKVLVGAAAGEVVEDSDGVVGGDEAVGEIDADEAGATGYQDSPAGVLSQVLDRLSICCRLFL